MEARPILVGNWCFVCGGDLRIFGRLVHEASSFSDKPLIKFIETFTGIELNENLSAESPNTEVCQLCVDKVEEYDRICLRAAEIQEEISELFKGNQTRLYEELHCDTCQTQFQSQDEMNSHECIDENIEFDPLFDYEEVDDGTEFSAEEGVIESSPSKKTKRTGRTSCYFCDTCGEQFNKRRAYQSHIKLAHLPEDAEIFNCTDCNTDPFATKESLELHMEIVHNKDPNCSSFKCPVCDKTFHTKSLLSRHFGIHANQRPRTCDICGKSFFHYSSFYAHKKLHDDIRDFPCPQCSKAFRNQSHLTRHLKSHTKTKNHECPECGLKFAERYNLTAHLNAHYGILRKKTTRQRTE